MVNNNGVKLVEAHKLALFIDDLPLKDNVKALLENLCKNAMKEAFTKGVNKK